MGRLKAGESLYTPPACPKKALTTRPCHTRTRSQKILRTIAAMLEEEDDETNSYNTSNDISEEVGTSDDVSSDDTDPLLLLRQFPVVSHNDNHNFFNQLAPATRELYSLTAESVKKLLVSELSSNSNVENMVELANNAFRTLDWLRADYAKLYDGVRALISSRAELSSAESELRTHDESHLEIKSEDAELDEQEEEKRNIVEKIKQAEAGVERSIKTLSSLG
uniref:Uncharacterized protein n=1 Tax=Fagus sylvatica TaxID=28930 RepID=A0A2N9GZS9_FAGSY